MRDNHYTMVARKLILDSLKAANVKPNESIGVAVSGGADSSALLLGLSKIYKGDKARFVHVLTVDHQLQAETAIVSQDVADFGASLGFHVHTVPVSIVNSGEGLESDARRARYEALSNLAEENDLSVILLGHTKSDQAEQVMLGLLRGSGTKSLGGMPKQRGIFLRPFLSGLNREDTVSVCDENKYHYWSDPHNDLKIYRRVAIRKLISAVEKETGESIVNPLVRSAQINREDAEALDAFVSIAEPKVVASDWSTSILLDFPTAVRKRLYRKKLAELGAKSDKLTFDLMNRVEDLLLNWKGQGAISINGGYTVNRKNDKIVFRSTKTF